MKKTSTAILALLIAAPVAAGGLTRFKDWADSPQAYFLSKAEREKWATISSDEAAENFIADYKAARGKGFAAAIQSRIDVAEKTYKTGKMKGAKSPLGRTLILLGSPTTTEKKTTKEKTKTDMSGADSVASEPGGRGGASGAGSVFSNVGGPGANTMRGMQLPEPSITRWIYQGANVPAGLDAKELTIEFEEDAAGTATFKDPAQTEALFQKVVEHWAPKAR
jgi:GWxTD domain-containing protein